MAAMSNVPEFVKLTLALGALEYWYGFVTDEKGALDLSEAALKADIRTSQDQSSPVVASWSVQVDSTTKNLVSLSLDKEAQTAIIPDVTYYSDLWITEYPLPIARFIIVFTQLVTDPTA